MSVVVDGDGGFGAVGGAGAGLVVQLGGHVGDLDHAVPVVVGFEHVGRERVAPPVAGARSVVDTYSHDGELYRRRPTRGLSSKRVRSLH